MPSPAAATAATATAIAAALVRVVHTIHIVLIGGAPAATQAFASGGKVGVEGVGGVLPFVVLVPGGGGSLWLRAPGMPRPTARSVRRCLPPWGRAASALTVGTAVGRRSGHASAKDAIHVGVKGVKGRCAAPQTGSGATGCGRGAGDGRRSLIVGSRAPLTAAKPIAGAATTIAAPTAAAPVAIATTAAAVDTAAVAAATDATTATDATAATAAAVDHRNPLAA